MTGVAQLSVKPVEDVSFLDNCFISSNWFQRIRCAKVPQLRGAYADGQAGTRMAVKVDGCFYKFRADWFFFHFSHLLPCFTRIPSHLRLSFLAYSYSSCLCRRYFFSVYFIFVFARKNQRRNSVTALINFVVFIKGSELMANYINNIGVRLNLQT